jgi:hypothetical protein
MYIIHMTTTQKYVVQYFMLVDIFVALKKYVHVVCLYESLKQMSNCK